MADKQHLYLVDGSAYIFRAYHRLPPLTNPQGTPVGAVYGYTTMLWKLAEDLDKAEGPTHLAVILDKSSQSFRNEIYDQYKANRPEPPEDLVPQFPLIRDATRAFSLPCIEEPDVEADDIIASYARTAAAQGWDVTIVSSDKDLMQLVGTSEAGGTIDMLDTMKSARIGPEEVQEKFGVPPELVGDVLTQSRLLLAQSGAQSAADVRSLETPVIAFSAAIFADLQELRAFLFHQLYRHPQVNRRRNKTTQIIRDLFELYDARPNLLLGEAGMAEAMDNPVARAGVVTDTIASMTDKAAIEEHRRQFDLYSAD